MKSCVYCICVWAYIGIIFSFRDGEYQFDFNERTKDKIVEFMKE